jgi:N-acetylmuramoyl-L-alanine amidase
MVRRGMALMILLMAALAMSSPSTAAGAAGGEVVATATRLGGDRHESRIVIDLQKAVTPDIFTLANPYRVVLDLPGVVFRAPPPEAGRGLIGTYRFGLMSRDRSRVVIDVTEPVKVDRTYTVPPAGGQPARLVVTLVPTTAARFVQEMAVRQPPAQTPAMPAATPSRDTRPLIVLDPGHGGIDPGTHAASGVKEKDIVLAFAKALEGRLLATGRYRVLMTRADDTYVALDDRVAFARDHQARLFISIHADSLSDSDSDASVRGATAYTLSAKASDAEAARLAEKENRSDVIAGVDLAREPDAVAGILIDLARRETHVFSLRFARDLVHDVGSVMPLNKRPLRAAGFVVLKAPDVPSVLIELGYMSNAADLANLTSAAWRDKTASAMAQAVEEFFGPRMVAGGPGAVN